MNLGYTAVFHEVIWTFRVQNTTELIMHFWCSIFNLLTRCALVTLTYLFFFSETKNELYCSSILEYSVDM